MSAHAPEIWAPIDGFPIYEVSTHGRIRNIQTGLQLKPIHKGGGYFQVNLHHEKTSTIFVIHRLVAAAFCPLRPGGIVRHLDGNPSNNHASNLAWGTARENIFDTVRHGRHNNKSKTHCPHGHEYTPENTFVVKGRGVRRCRTCINVARRARRRAIRTAGAA